MEKALFKIVLTKEVESFIKGLPRPAADKIIYNIHRIVAGEKDKELFKKLENSDIWEFRTLYNKTSYRIFAFWDKSAETLVITTHGIIKKTHKTPLREIAKAEKIMCDYFNSKK